MTPNSRSGPVTVPGQVVGDIGDRYSTRSCESPPLAAVEQLVDLAGVKAGLVEIKALAGWRLQLRASSSSSSPY
jgi:hypothetical protein